jgi:hypothetical protein
LSHCHRARQWLLVDAFTNDVDVFDTLQTLSDSLVTGQRELPEGNRPCMMGLNTLAHAMIELDVVTIIRDRPDLGIRAGAVGTIVSWHPDHPTHPGGTIEFSCEPLALPDPADPEAGHRLVTLGLQDVRGATAAEMNASDMRGWPLMMAVGLHYP